jgi:indolepyruvate ferredoxin oxidoreductase beta subunit
MNIVIAAVGGQGALFASHVIGRVALDKGLDVKVSEVHGMSQRGGSVVTYVRYGERIASPVVEEGFADVVMAFEMLEGGRYVSYLKRGGTAIVSTQKINPLPVLLGSAAYPDDIPGHMRKLGVTVKVVDALAAAREAGNVRATNAVMLGVLATVCDFSGERWRGAIRETSPAKFAETNLKAFEKGYRGVGI